MLGSAEAVTKAGYMYLLKNILSYLYNINIICLIQSHMVTGYCFWGGPIALHGLVHFRNTTGPSLTKVVYTHFDRISYVYT